MVANGSHQVTFAQIEQMVTKLFDRYDTDESGTMVLLLHANQRVLLILCVHRIIGQS